jgi:DNA-binding transcriptional ArsR family regulator
MNISLPGILKHVRALEDARLVTTRKEGRIRTCQLTRRPLDDAARWIDQRRLRWERQLDQFARHVERVEGATR